MTPEARVKKKVKRLLIKMEQEDPNLWWTSLSQRYHSGMSDFMMIQQGRTTFIETKAPGESLRKLQDWFRRRVTRAGASHWTVTEKDNRLIILENGVELNEKEVE